MVFLREVFEKLILYYLHAGYFFILFLSSADFFSKLTFSKDSFSNTTTVSNSLDHDRHLVRPDLGPYCLQRLLADDTCRQKIKTISILYSQTGRTFFHRYPSLYQFLLEQLEESTVTMETGGSFHLHPALYPILMVLGHLFPSAMEGTDTALNLAAFIPYVIGLVF